MAELTAPPTTARPPATTRSSSSARGPGGLQVSYSLRPARHRHAVISADPSPGRHVPALAVLPAPAVLDQAARPGAARARARTSGTTGTACSATSRRRGRSSRGSWTGPRTSRRARRWRPTSPRSPSGRARRPLRLPLDRDATRGRRRTAPRSSSRRPTATTAREALVVAVGVAEPFTPPGPGMELTHHYADVRPAETYAGRASSSSASRTPGFELANGLLPWARQLVLASPSHGAAVGRHAVAGRRPGALRPALRGPRPGRRRGDPRRGDRPHRARGRDGELAVHVRRTDGGGDLVLEVDDVIAATGFVTPLRGPAGPRRRDVRGQPAAGPDAWWESTTVPGHLLRGTIGQGAKGLASTAAVQLGGGPRRALQRPGPGRRTRRRRGSASSAERRRRARRPRRPRRAELAEAPELLHQRGYLARVLTADPDGGPRRRRRPAADPRARRGRPGRARAHARGRRDGRDLPGPVHADRRDDRGAHLDPDPLLRYDRPEARRAIAEVVRTVVADAVARQTGGSLGRAAPVGPPRPPASRGAWGRRTAAWSGRAPAARRTTSRARRRRPDRGSAACANATSSSSVRSRMSVMT